MKVIGSTCFASLCFLLTLPAFAEPPAGAVAVATTGGCSYFEAGTGGDVRKAMRSLKVDLDHGVSLTMLPGNIATGPAYALSLSSVPDGKWSLTYAIEKGELLRSRAFRATVPFFAVDLAKRIENVWTHAIADAKPKSGNCTNWDGMSYIFSANGQQANNFAGSGEIAGELLDISDTLKIIVMEANITGHPVGAGFDRLHGQLDRIERDLKINLQH